MAWLKVAFSFGSLLLKSVKENPKLLRLLLEIGAGIWIVVCCLTHCGSGNGGFAGKSDTVRVSDTVLIYDTAWKSLIGDTIVYYEQRLRELVWEAPEADYTNSNDCSDSLDVAIKTLDYCDEMLTRADAQYRMDYSLRGYTDTISDDTIQFVYNLDVRGRLAKKPKFDYKLLIPERIVTNTITVTNTLGPRRALYVGGSAGPVFDTKGPDWNAMTFSFRFGYTDLKNNSYGLRTSYMTLNLWAIEIEYTRSFAFGKQQVISKD